MSAAAATRTVYELIITRNLEAENTTWDAITHPTDLKEYTNLRCQVRKASFTSGQLEWTNLSVQGMYPVFDLLNKKVIFREYKERKESPQLDNKFSNVDQLKEATHTIARYNVISYLVPSEKFSILLGKRDLYENVDFGGNDCICTLRMQTDKKRNDDDQKSNDDARTENSVTTPCIFYNSDSVPDIFLWHGFIFSDDI
jgi:hypothetical protein